MKLGLMQPYFFPYIGYWQLLNVVDTYVIADDYKFSKHVWIKRNDILSSGERKSIYVQMHKASSNSRICDMELIGNGLHAKKVIRTISYNYSKAPFYGVVFPIIEEIIMSQECNLAKYLEHAIRSISKYLLINTNIVKSTSLPKKHGLDMQGKIIDVCRCLDADEYINAIGGRKLYSREEFLKHGINLGFLKTKQIEYEQFDNEFVPNLSIIDVMMFNSPQEISEMLGEYEIV